jgi:hypothetical protein
MAGADGDGRSLVQATANSTVAAMVAAPERTTNFGLIELLARKGREKVTPRRAVVKQETARHIGAASLLLRHLSDRYPYRPC